MSRLRTLRAQTTRHLDAELLPARLDRDRGECILLPGLEGGEDVVISQPDDGDVGVAVVGCDDSEVHWHCLAGLVVLDVGFVVGVFHALAFPEVACLGVVVGLVGGDLL